MKSMTGYGEASQQSGATKVSVQVRSLNHRHLDLQLRVPREYMALEEEIRKTIREKISRGRIDLFVNRLPGKAQAHKLEMDEALLGQYLASIKQAKKKHKLAGEVSVALLPSVPDLFHVREVEVDIGRERKALFNALIAALKKLEQSREREGRQLKADMQSQVNQMTRITSALEERAAELGVRQQKGPAGRAGDNGGRGENLEVASVVLKGDINEELVRLRSHVTNLGQVLRETEPVGKKIDFMLQEVNRELNTISSKVPQLPVVQLVLEGKERVEKIREQTQNIE
ncbi:MAG: YicC family protein [Deltaproteobacteria bacterium]|nr:YicC family protein [Deltaproteobacteria bacterium]